jgi:hypothetical protein
MLHRRRTALVNAAEFVRTTARKVTYRLYQPQVKLIFPIPVLRTLLETLPPVPSGYSVRSPLGDDDLASWATLLDEAKEFGSWTPERVRREILSGLLTPQAASLAFFSGELVGCASTADASTATKRRGYGMYLYLRKDHRARGLVAHILAFRTMGYFFTEKYDEAIVTTDPHRAAALALYLTAGALPVYDSLYSPVQWHRIRRRLRKVLKRHECRRALSAE